jgi:hypothetical protein
MREFILIPSKVFIGQGAETEPELFGVVIGHI